MIENLEQLQALLDELREGYDESWQFALLDKIDAKVERLRAVRDAAPASPLEPSPMLVQRLIEAVLRVVEPDQRDGEMWVSCDMVLARSRVSAVLALAAGCPPVEPEKEHGKQPESTFATGCSEASGHGGGTALREHAAGVRRQAVHEPEDGAAREVVADGAGAAGTRGAVAAAGRTGPPLDPWQSIETAPRPEHGRRKVIDVWCVTDDYETAKFYFGKTMCGVKDRHLWQGRVSEVYWLDGAWRPATGLRMHGLTVTPTHWMPLPAVPRGGDTPPKERT